MARSDTYVFEGSLNNLLQGVSQQIPRERLDGQVATQLNMVSDVVNGLQRRPGARVIKTNLLAGATFNQDSIFAVYHSAGGSGRHAVVNTTIGKVEVFDDSFTSLGSFTNAYLIAATARSIQSVALRGRGYIVNTEVTPAVSISNTNKQNPDLTGFFFIKTGAFSKTYAVNITTSGGTYTVSYTTPDGTTAGDAAKAVPTYIATQLVTAINAHTPSPFVTCSQSSGYVFLNCSGAYTSLSISTDSGSAYIGASNQSAVTNITDLPALLPAAGYNTLCAVGATKRTAIWYRYSGSKSIWLEDSDWNSPSAITNLFVSFSLYDAVDLKLEVGEGRLAGSDDTNELPAFLDIGITGVSAYQGRLVLLCGSEVVMSASGQPLRYFRSTVTELLDEDPIGVMAGSASAADFMYALQFNRDLLLFSSTCQAVIPGTSSPVSPSTAQIVLTSSYAGDNNASPVDTGRSVLFPAPISESFAGFFELVPSNYTASQYTSVDITQHLPRYMPGRIVKCVSSTNIGMVLSKLSGDVKSLFVHQYKWDNENKLQGAWHQWSFPFDVCTVWFSNDKILLAFNTNSQLCIASVELQAGSTVGGLTRPLTDLYSSVTVTAGKFTVPVALRSLVTEVDDVVLTYTTGSLAGEWAGVDEINTSTWVATVARTIADGTYFVGAPFSSVVTPTPPILKDKNGAVFGLDATLIRYILHTMDTDSFQVKVYNSNTVISDVSTTPVLAASPDIELEYPVIGALSDVVVPVRSVAQDTTMVLTCTGVHQMRILGIDYLLRYHPRRRRL